MKPVLIQHLIKNNKKQVKPTKIEDVPIVDTATPLTKFIFWALAIVIILSILLA